MTDQKKILYVINHVDWFWSHRLPLAKAAQDAGYQVHIAVKDGPQDQRFSEHGFTVHDFPSMQALRILMKKQKPDIVHAITLKTAFFTALSGLGMTGIRFVHTIAGLGYLFSNSLKANMLRFFLSPILRGLFKQKNTKLIFQNADDLGVFLAKKYVHSDQASLIKGSGVDLNEFQFSKGPQNDQPIITMPTRLVHGKGVAVFIEAAKILETDGIDAKFQIAGGVSKSNPDSISDSEMKNMLQGSSVEWLGKVTDMPALYVSSDIIVFPSYYREGVPKVLLEACAVGRPIVTTDHPGCRETVSDGENGYLVPIKDSKTLAESIKKLINNKGLCEEMGLKSRQKAEKEFNVLDIVSQTLNIYEEH